MQQVRDGKCLIFFFFFFLGGGGGGTFFFNFNGVLPGNETMTFFVLFGIFSVTGNVTA